MDSNRAKENEGKMPGMVKIKVEPGTSSTTVPNSTTRLTSFRLPRDLTLGGPIKTEKTVKKLYTPNINVQRNKKKEDCSTGKNESIQKPGRGRGRGRGGSDRGRSRGKISANLIQSTGVFSEGMSDSGRSARRSSSWRNSASDREPKITLEQSKLNLDYKIDKAEEEEKLKLLLKDDFIDDGEEVNMDNAPIALPLIEEVQLYKNPLKKGENIIYDNKKEEQVDRKPIILENGDAVMPPKKNKTDEDSISIDGKECPITVPQIIDNHSTGYMLITFPDCLPGVQSTDDSDPRINKSKDQKIPGVVNSNDIEYCTLNTLNDGFLGKIQIHQSGKAILCLGDNTLMIDVGSRQSFRQDLIVAKVDGSNSELVNLGQVTSTLICSPDWESMLASL